MSLSRSSGPKKGNNSLIFIAGILVIILLAMIFWGMSRNSSIEQLISSAAPDSSAFASDSLLVAAGEQEIAEEQPEEKPVESATPPAADSTAAVADSTNAVAQASETPAAAPVVSNEGGETLYAYKIRKGDTMYKLAARFGNKPADIMALNGLSDMSVQADKTIKVKVKALHSVGAGEGLNAIAEKYSVSAKSIKIANDMKDDVLSQGASILIPLK